MKLYQHSRSFGLSLLEVILAIAILALSMAAIGELIRMGNESAGKAQELTRAQILCESKLSEIVAGAQQPTPINRVQFPADPGWYYSVALAPTDEQSVMALSITVETHIERKRPVQFSLVRWIPDPGIELPDELEQPTDEQLNAASSGGSNNGATGGGNITGGDQSGGSAGGNSGGGNNPNIPPGVNPPPGVDLPPNLPGNIPDDILNRLR